MLMKKQAGTITHFASLWVYRGQPLARKTIQKSYFIPFFHRFYLHAKSSYNVQTYTFSFLTINRFAKKESHNFRILSFKK